MSLHLIECVRPIQGLLPSEKLALLAFADSADSETQIGWPGIDAVAEWAGVSTSRAKAIVKGLVEKGLLRRYSAATGHRRARYVVFPQGCCAEHPRPRDDDEQTPATTVEQLAVRLGIPLDDTNRPLLAQLADQQDKGPVHSTPLAEEGDRPQSSMSGEGSRMQYPTDPATPTGVLPTAPHPGEGSRLGTAGSTRSSGTTTSPPTPHASGPGGDDFGEPCPAHKPTGFADNCRGCGTTPRQLRKREERRQRLAAAAGRGPRCPAGTPWSTDGSCGCPPNTHPTRLELDRAAS